MSREHVERRLAAILAADVAGSCRLIGIDEEGALAQLKALRKTLFDPKISDHRGRIVKNTGDGALVEFGSVVDALRCAVEIQRGMAEQNIDVPPVKRIEFRIGIHVGDIVIEENDIFGEGVNIAVRLEEIAEPGGISISDDAYRQIRGKVDITFEDTGSQSLKNIAEPIRVWRVRIAAISSPAMVTNLSSETAQPLPLPDEPSIAVLPFENMSGDPKQEYFADGMVEDIITGLSRSKSLFVIARHSTFTYKGKAFDIKQVGRELGVRYVLEGSVRRAGNRVRISGQLIDAATGKHIWADRFDSQLDDIFDLQDRVTMSVIGAISPQLERAEIERAKHKPTASLQAYDYYLRALAYFRKFTSEANIEALKLTKRIASDIDPEFAAAYALGARCYVQRKTFGWSTAAQERVEARRLARRAIELDRDDPSVLARAGNVLAFLGEVEEGAALLSRAINLDPNLATARHWSGWVHLYLGDVDAAIEQFQVTLRLNPLDPRIFIVQTGLAYAHFFAARNADATLWATTAFRQQPNYRSAQFILAACHATSGRIEEAREICAQLNPPPRISRIRDRTPFRRAEDIDRLAQAFRIAGMPE
ncbi:adenylate/guanylate cyclase domain-containing protein [Bradyrhizobium sp. sBnM-33]|uniref:adenylate/guanylate cyclase domain-containing protein n=1 Tax=Bradyrhizobium sp. sBnM-33 TaxID=2831780 RepID=UPI0020BD4C7C|nr:adenylate/guanylate cyclase domain-containing protein [Bradyrhizobium sp. sBnM-33]WOH49281.1 adenylate/guanylate cyclase domain-containing protein [Bradyrhizobium sp. sBnM-33]